MRLGSIFAAAALLAGCSSIAVTGSTGDGETFSGTALGEGVVDQYGTLRLVSSRGVSCFGPWQFDNGTGPKGRATLHCSDGRIANAALDMPSRSGAGKIGESDFSFRW